MHKLLSLFLLVFFTTTFAKDPFALPSFVQTQRATIQINHLSANTVSNLIKKNSTLISPQGNILVDPIHNQLLIEETPPHLDKIRSVIAALDKPRHQISIKAKIILIDDSGSKELGLYFNQLMHTPDNSGIELPLLELNHKKLITLKLIALAQQGHAVILSQPQLITNNQQTAKIESGEQIPYQQQGTYGNTSIKFKKAVLGLTVTPTLMPQHNITLALTLNQDKPSNLLIKGTPAISTEHLQTTVTVHNQQTLILGGIFEQNSFSTNSHVPFLARLPLLGKLFKQTHQQQQHKQLLIMITPSVVN